MRGESRDELVERVLAQLSDSERRSLQDAAEALDKVARKVDVDVLAELEQGRDLLEIVAMVAERRRRRTP